MQELAGKHIVLGLTGGVACYKSAQLCRLLIKAGASVQVVMTAAAEQFIGTATMQALSRRLVATSQSSWSPNQQMAHIELGRWADVCLIAPCSADFIARLGHGRADDLLSLLCLARPIAKVPLLLAPAMNREMWAHPATQRNLAQVVADGAQLLGVDSGEQACGETGLGRMLEPADLLDELVAFCQPKLLAGKRVLLNAGPTYEAIDPVRGLTNLSSGKMGFALARAARQAGADVTLVTGPVGLATPRGVARIDVVSGQQMLAAVLQHIEHADIFIATAAVADWRATEVAAQKIKKGSCCAAPSLDLVTNTDILATVAQSQRAQSGALFCVGFAAESENLQAHTQAKRLQKGVPLMVGNIGPATFGQDHNSLLLVDEQGALALPVAEKQELARQLIGHIAARLT